MHSSLCQFFFPLWQYKRWLFAKRMSCVPCFYYRYCSNSDKESVNLTSRAKFSYQSFGWLFPCLSESAQAKPLRHGSASSFIYVNMLDLFCIHNWRCIQKKASILAIINLGTEPSLEGLLETSRPKHGKSLPKLLSEYSDLLVRLTDLLSQSLQ